MNKWYTDEPAALWWGFRYCVAQEIPCWVRYVNPKHRDYPFPGVMVELIRLGADACDVKLANGDMRTVPTETLSIGVSPVDHPVPFQSV